MDRLWTPWRYQYVSAAKGEGRKGVPAALDGWSGEDRHCVFCNLIGAVEWGIEQDGGDPEASERAGYVIARLQHCFVCLNAFPYSSGHVLLVPYRHVSTLGSLSPGEFGELMGEAQRTEQALTSIYRPDGINLGLNLGEAAGAGVAHHLHFHMVPRWFGDTNFMTVTAETRILPESLDVTWSRLRDGLTKTSIGPVSPPPKL